MPPLTITTDQYAEAFRVVLDVINVPMPVRDQDEDVRARILVCRTMHAAAFIESLLGISDGDSLPMDDFDVSLAYLRSQVDEYPIRYLTWADVDADPVLQPEAPVYLAGRPQFPIDATSLADAPESEA